MKKEIYLFLAPIFLIFLSINLNSAQITGEIGWENLNKSIWNNISTWNITSEELAEIELNANLSATELWVQVNISPSRIDFGKVEKGNIYNKTYSIAARGNVDVIIKPELTNQEDKIFSNLLFSRTTTNRRRIGDYFISFNLTKNKGYWSVIGSYNNLKNFSSDEKGTQYIWLDLTNFRGIIPFDEQYRNKLKFKVIPIRSENPYEQ